MGRVNEVTLYEQAAWLAGQGREADAEPLVAETRQIFGALGATPWLERVDALGIDVTSTVASPG